MAGQARDEGVSVDHWKYRKKAPEVSKLNHRKMIADSSLGEGVGEH